MRYLVTTPIPQPSTEDHTLVRYLVTTPTLHGRPHAGAPTVCSPNPNPVPTPSPPNGLSPPHLFLTADTADTADTAGTAESVQEGRVRASPLQAPSLCLTLSPATPAPTPTATNP